MMSNGERLGATYLGNGETLFHVWAPNANKVEVHLLEENRFIELTPKTMGYFGGRVGGVCPGARYMYRLDGEREFPDPASQYQPDGVHKASEVVDSAFPWQDQQWYGLPLEDYIIYELHVGTYTLAGTFDSIIPLLPQLKGLGVTAVELMPNAQFPVDRNWGYDGTFPYAAQNSYGGPDGLRRLVNACHQYGLAVILDVVYNHLGPEANYLHEFGPYFTERYRALWGWSINFDGPGSDEGRRYFIENALVWLRDFHFDALRLDAVHSIYDFAAGTFLQDLSRNVLSFAQRLPRKIYLFAESDLNNPRLVQPLELGGYGLHSQWTDDFHHALHVLLTGDLSGNYQDYGGDGRFPTRLLAKCFREGYAYTGQYSPFRQRRHGLSSRSLPAVSHVVFSQNHDQVGNRMLGERLSQLVSFDKLKLAAGVELLSPFIPLLFMGEEYGEEAPFLYFVSHTDPELVKAVREGRKLEFAGFQDGGEPPDPLSVETFERSKLNHDLQLNGWHRILCDLYLELIRLRKANSALSNLSKEDLIVSDEIPRLMILRRWADHSEVMALFNFNDEAMTVPLELKEGEWRLLIDSSAPRWRQEEGPDLPGAQAPIVSSREAEITVQPHSFILYGWNE